MNNEILRVINLVANEKDISKDAVFSATERAIAAVTQKKYNEDVIIRVSIDRETGEYDTKRVWQVVKDGDEDFDPELHIKLTKAKEYNSELSEGDEIEEIIQSEGFGRIESSQAKQVITRIVRDAERAQLALNHQKYMHEILSGRVKRITRDQIILDMPNNIEGAVPRNESIPREAMRIGDRIRGYLYEIIEEGRGPLLHLSRTRPELLVQLFQHEVPEINDGTITIKAAARDPGSRAKIAVKASDTRIDPIGACIGVRGSRVQVVSNELNGERIDIILWDDNPAHLAINAIAPAEVSSITLNEIDKTMDIAVSEDQLSQAIGRNGQNVRLASDLTGWKINIMSVEQAHEKIESDHLLDKELFIEKLDVDDNIANILIREGFKSISDLAHAEDQLKRITEFDNETAEELANRAKMSLLSDTLSEDNNTLKHLKSMTEAIARQLIAHKIETPEQLADLSVDELTEIPGIKKNIAAKLIMEAREPWFENEKKDE